MNLGNYPETIHILRVIRGRRHRQTISDSRRSRSRRSELLFGGVRIRARQDVLFRESENLLQLRVYLHTVRFNSVVVVVVLRYSEKGLFK